MPLFADLDHDESRQIARLFKERRFAAGETVIKEGSGGAAFFVIESGEATVTVRGTERASLGPGDYFGEIALDRRRRAHGDDHRRHRSRLLRAHATGSSGRS